MIRFRLLCSSLAPLLLILGVRLWKDHWEVAAALVAAAIGAAMSLMLLMRSRESLSSQNYVLNNVHDESGEIPAYLVTYLLPFVTLNIAGWNDFVGYLLLAAVLVVLVVRTDLVYVQPLLLAVGWHLYRVEVQGGYEARVMISGYRLRTGQSVSTVGLRGPVSRVLKVED